MGLLARLAEWRHRRAYASTGRDIARGLDRAWHAAGHFELSPERPVIVFSDHHKGARDGADDFQRCERTYNAALAYYHELGYHLIELGDVEELWENRFEEVVKAYPVTLELAARFVRDGRYTRFFGNHDLAWNNPKLFRERMWQRGYDGVTPLEALRVRVPGAGGELFLVHGHQGTADSDRYAKLSELGVRYGWRPLQRLLNRPWNTPSVDWDLRGEHAEHMRDWAAARGRVVVAGHTHLPVFFQSADQPEAAPADGAPAGDDPRVAGALRAAREQWAKADAVRLEHQKPLPMAAPWYFNTGCCAFGDGDITGIELAGGRISLIRWPCESGTTPERLASIALSEVFERVARAGTES